MFGLTGSTDADVLASLAKRNATVWAEAESEQRILAYALSQLESAAYSDPSSPPVLIRGGGRNIVFFCNQFSTDYGVSVDECVSRYFAPGSVLQVFPNWSTSRDASVTQHYTGSILYHVLPNKQTRKGWHARAIKEFSVDIGSEEWIYPANSRFAVIDVQCLPNRYWNVTLLEISPGTDSTRSRPSKTMPFKNCVYH